MKYQPFMREIAIVILQLVLSRKTLCNLTTEEVRGLSYTVLLGSEKELVAAWRQRSIIQYSQSQKRGHFS